MSRIHEALRRAEEEKQAGHSTPAETPVAPVPVGTDPLAGAAPELAALAPAASKPSGLDAETLLATCPAQAWKPDMARMLFFASNHRDQMGMEQFRTLRSRLYQIREKRHLRSVLVGSALPAEGKTFVAANLAQALARQRGRRVLLIDADLRKPGLHECLGAPAEPGLSGYLRGELQEMAILQRGPMEGLFLIPSGKSVTNPSELVANGRLQTLLASMAAVFDWIVIDSPPVVPVSDAALMAGMCDAVLLVVLAGGTPFEMAQKAKEEFRAAPVLGVVLNRVEEGSSYPSYYYRRYGSYGHGSTEQAKQGAGR